MLQGKASKGSSVPTRLPNVSLPQIKGAFDNNGGIHNIGGDGIESGPRAIGLAPYSIAIFSPSPSAFLQGRGRGRINVALCFENVRWIYTWAHDHLDCSLGGNDGCWCFLSGPLLLLGVKAH
jgi:hypothetical protein